MSTSIVVEVNVKFPELGDLVTYLKSRDDAQSKINALTTQVDSLTNSLKQSTDDLKTVE